jgi:hypothetical protein
MKYPVPRLESEFEQSDDLLHEIPVSGPSLARGGESCTCSLSVANGPSEPMKCLMRGVLADAVQCFQTNLGAQDGLRAEDFGDVLWWLFENEADGPFSFERVCSVLALDPGCLRQTLAAFARDRIPVFVQRRAGRAPVTRLHSREPTDAARRAPAGDAEQPNNCAKIMFDRISARRAPLPSNGSTVTCVSGVAARRSTFR